MLLAGFAPATFAYLRFLPDFFQEFSSRGFFFQKKARRALLYLAELQEHKKTKKELIKKLIFYLVCKSIMFLLLFVASPSSQTKTAATTVLVHNPFLSPTADWAIAVVLTILSEIFHISFFSS